MSRVYEALQRARPRADAHETVLAESGKEGDEVSPPAATEGSRVGLARPELASAADGASSGAGGHGFFNAEPQPGNTASPTTKAVFPTFLRPEDDRTFQDVLRDLARDEEASTSGAGRGEDADDSRKHARVVGMHAPLPSDATRRSSGTRGHD